MLFFSLEMPRREIGMRLMAARSGVPVQAMRSGTDRHEHWDRMADALGPAQAHRLWIDDKPAVSVPYVRARAQRLKRTKGLDLIVVDYLGLMKGDGDNRTQEQRLRCWRRDWRRCSRKPFSPLQAAPRQ